MGLAGLRLPLPECSVLQGHHVGAGVRASSSLGLDRTVWMCFVCLVIRLAGCLMPDCGAEVVNSGVSPLPFPPGGRRRLCALSTRCHEEQGGWSPAFPRLSNTKRVSPEPSPHDSLQESAPGQPRGGAGARPGNSMPGRGTRWGRLPCPLQTPHPGPSLAEPVPGPGALLTQEPCAQGQPLCTQLRGA